MQKIFTSKHVLALDSALRDRVIRSAWEDDVSFDSIFIQFGLTEQQTIKLMKTIMKPKMFNIWRERVQGRPEKHFKKMTILTKETSRILL